MRPHALLLIAVLVLVACTGAVGTPSATPGATADINRSRIDIAYTAFVAQDVHNVSSRAALLAAVEGLKAEAKKTGGSTEFRALELQDTHEPVISDFKRFADAAAEFAARNRQLSANRIADAAIAAMIAASPDCHTYYVNPEGVTFRSKPYTPTGTNAQIPAGGTSLGGPDEAGLTGKMLSGGIAYITWRAWVTTGTYKINDALRAMLDKAVGMGAKAWLFDLRGNPGGIASTDEVASWFLDGEPMLVAMFRNGAGGTATAQKAFRLGPAYQLPLAIVVNDRSASASEFLVADLKENRRATIVGQKTVGCLGSFYSAKFLDGGQIAVVAQEYIGAVTGAKYNNDGVPPDVSADDATAVDKAIEILKKTTG